MSKSILITAFVLILTISASYAKDKEKKEGPAPNCTGVGTISCPKGFKPSCPKQYTPSCVFVSNKQAPACLANNVDGTIFNYNINNITCKKGKW